MICRCIVCGKLFEHSGKGRSPKTCSDECLEEHNSTYRREYWQTYKRRRYEPRKTNKKPKENSLEAINEMARERHLTYGQMQGVFYCQEHPIR